MSSTHQEWLEKQMHLQERFNLLVDPAVKAWIIYYKSNTLPSLEDREKAPKVFADTIFKADVIFRCEAQEGVIAGMFNNIAQSLAIMAFEESGISALGFYWKA